MDWMKDHTRSHNEYKKDLHNLYQSNGKRLDRHPAFTFCQQIVDAQIGRDADVRPTARSIEEIPYAVVGMVNIIMTIEEMAALMRQANTEANESLVALAEAHNKIVSMKDVVFPSLTAFTNEIRQSRMTTEREMKFTLEWLRNVREFFLEKNYDLEMTKLRDFISICREIQSLKEAGILDAVADLAIRLAVQERTS